MFSKMFSAAESDSNGVCIGDRVGVEMIGGVKGASVGLSSGSEAMSIHEEATEGARGRENKVGVIEDRDSGSGTKSVHEDTNEGPRGRESEIGEIGSEGVNLSSGSGTISAHEAENEAVGGKVGVIERMYSGSDSGLASATESAGMHRECKGDGEKEEGTCGSEMCRRSKGANECGEGKRGFDDDLEESLSLQHSNRNFCSCGQNVRGSSYPNAPFAHRKTSSNGKGMSGGWKGCRAMSRGTRALRSSG